MTQREALLIEKQISATTAHSSRSSQWVPLPRKPTGQEPQDQEPSGKLLHLAPGKHGLDRHPSIGQLLLLHIWCSVTSPTQSFPPYWGSGLLQTRVRSRIPPAQVTVQADQGDQGLQRPSIGHGARWQALVSRPLPLQFLPPIWGTGELQRRMRVTLPTPQVTEHEDQGDQ